MMLKFIHPFSFHANEGSENKMQSMSGTNDLEGKLEEPIYIVST